MTPQELHERVRADGLLGAGRQVVAMVSGGRDSVCLLDVAVAVHGADRVRALHVNYGLRGRDSDEDERYTSELCAQLGVRLELVCVSAEQRALGERSNLQAWARELRYRAARALADELDGDADVDGNSDGNGDSDGNAHVGGRGNAGGNMAGNTSTDPSETVIASGHTASDQVETILYRLAASPGRRALLGMASRDGRLVRPLLGVTREQTGAYCEARGLRWREDQSNADERYARVRVRRRLVPALRAVHPAAESSVLRTAELLRGETELLDALVAQELAGRDSIALARLAELHPAMARLIVVRLAEDTAGGYVPQAGMRVGEILELGARGGVGEVHVGGNVAARLSGGRLRMVRLPART
jgi:tRNA(Ile)-lysidine synthase